MENKETIKSKLLEFLQQKFDLSEDKAHEDEVVSNVKKSVDFKGANLWILIFATYIASIGLNINSTAVIIGAMLVSPLMGPIIGIGLAVGINDFELLKRSSRNFAFAVAMSLIVSATYFYLSPLTIAQSELLSRTQPTTWDVLIAFFGGLAGIVAQSRKDRTSTVIPGVAIATALMPPLCTAGFGLANLNMEYLFGAIYLFSINTIFIALATYCLVRFMKFKKKEFINPARERRIKRLMGLITIIVIVPSVLLAINIVRETTFKANVKHYVKNVFDFKDSQVINTEIIYSANKPKIEVTLIGKTISDDALEAIRNQQRNYDLENAVLTIKQQDTGDSTLVSTTIKSLDKLQSISQGIIKDREQKINDLSSEIEKYKKEHIPVEDIAKEFGAISGINNVEIAIAKVPSFDSNGNVKDTISACYVNMPQGKHDIPEASKKLIIEWLKVRTSSEDVKLIIE